ncbi:LacI family transcriptional regulator [Opitutaceae bacterium TAV5]|nr:LacI family transcriptional regulator [Opitutaceae bacterium TAV5]
MSTSKPPTLQTIANRAKVSRMTVSRALRNHPSLPRKTCERIQKIATRIGYRTNPLVSALMAQLRNGRPPKSHPTLAYLTTNTDLTELEPGRTHAADIYHGAIERAAMLGYKIEHFSLVAPDATGARISGERMRSILRARGIPGAILAPLADPFPHTDIDFDWEHFACAAIGYTLRNHNLHRADNDHFSAAALAADRLRELGYRRIGLAIRHEDNQRTQRKRVGGYLAAQAGWPAAHRIPPFLWHYRLPDTGMPEGFDTWFTRHRPDAILVLQHIVGWWLADLGHRVPEEVALASLNLQRDQATFSGINLNNALLGAAAVELVVEQIHHNEHGIPARAKTVMITGDWVDGATTRHHPVPAHTSGH